MKNSGDYIPMNPGGRRDPGDKRGSEQFLKLRRLVAALCRLAQAIEEAAQDLQFFVDRFQEGDVPEPLRQRQAGFRRSPNGEDNEILKQLANLGVTIAIARASDGSATVMVGQSQLILTSPALADLLEILCEDSGTRNDNDGLVGWKSIAEIAARLRKKTGRELRPHAITVSIWRLRSALKADGINRFYVQTNRRFGGFRFARNVKESPERGGNLM